MSGETVLVGGSVAQRPGSGGHTWVFLQYLLGLRRLGLEPVLIDWLEPEMCRDRAGAPSDVERSWNIAYLAERDGPLRPGRELGGAPRRAAGPWWG